MSCLESNLQFTYFAKLANDGAKCHSFLKLQKIAFGLNLRSANIKT